MALPSTWPPRIYSSLQRCSCCRRCWRASARPARGGIDASRRVCAVYSSRIRALHTRAQYGRAVSNREVPALLTYLLTYQASTTLYIYKRKKYAHNKCGNTTISTMYKCTCNAIRHKACVCGRVCGGSKDEAPALSHGVTLATRSRRCVWTHTLDQRGVAPCGWGARRGRPPRPALGWQTCSLVVAANGALGPGLGPAAPAGRMVQRCSPRGRARRTCTHSSGSAYASRRACRLAASRRPRACPSLRASARRRTRHPLPPRRRWPARAAAQLDGLTCEARPLLGAGESASIGRRRSHRQEQPAQAKLRRRFE